jgi:hypothetical protein
MTTQEGNEAERDRTELSVMKKGADALADLKLFSFKVYQENVYLTY